MAYPTPGVTRNYGQQLLDAIAADVQTAEVAAGVNATGTPTSLSASGGAGTIVVIPSTAVSVPNSGTRPVYLEFEAALQQTVAGDGNGFLLLYETTSGSTLLDYSPVRLPNSTATAISEVTWSLRAYRLGTVSSTRTFELRAYLYAIAANNPSANVLNSTGRSTVQRAMKY